MSFRSFIYYCALCGGWAALLGWLLGRTLMPDAVILQAGIKGMWLGLFVALALGLVDAVSALSLTQVQKVVLRTGAATVVGCGGGLLGGMVGQALFTWTNLSLFLIFGWTVTGLLVGASVGSFEMVASLIRKEDLDGARRKVRNGLLGGGVGGLLGGTLFLLLRGVWNGILSGRPIERMWSPSAVGFVALGMCIGLLMGLAQVVLREAWVRVEAGFRPGRELLLSRAETLIGRAEACGIGLFGDSGVDLLHARILLQNGRYFLADADSRTGTYLNEMRITEPVPLRTGDLIRVGNSVLRFGEQQTRRPAQEKLIMPQIVTCPYCTKPMQLADGLAGKQVRCPFCKQVFPIPAPVAAVAAAASPPAPALRPVPPPPPPPAPAPAPDARLCPACRAPLLAEAEACMDCGSLVTKTAAPAPAPVPPISLPPLLPSVPAVRAARVPPVHAPAPPSRPSRAAAAAPWWANWRQTLPAALLLLTLGGMMIRDVFIKDDAPEADEAEAVVEVPVDPNPLLQIEFQPKTMRFGLSMTHEVDAQGLAKRLTFSKEGLTNNAFVRLDGNPIIFGKFQVISGDFRNKGQTEGGVLSPIQDYPPLRGRWVDQEVALGKDAKGRQRQGKQSVYRYDPEAVEVTQTVELIPGAVSPRDGKRHLDTCLVTYRIENKDASSHRVGLRFVLDTFIGGNDGVPFTVPGMNALCVTDHDFATPAQVPDFIQALEYANLERPGTIAHLTLKPGGRLEPPSRVTLGRWINQLTWPPGQDPHIEWQFPVRPINSEDSGVVLYWDDKELPPRGVREAGFAYGLGHVASSEGGGQLALTLGGSFRPGEEFSVTAYSRDPVPGQTVTLRLPKGLTLVQGAPTQEVPMLPAGASTRNSPVSWKVKAARVGRYTLRVQSSTGAKQTEKATIKSNGIFD